MSGRQSEDPSPVPTPRAPRIASQVTVVAMRPDAERTRGEATGDRRHAEGGRLHVVDPLDGASRDGLTGALKRDSGQIRLQREVDRTHAHRGVLAMALLEVVGLERINDHDGCASGDAVLVAVGTALVDKLRSCDLVVRWGGGTFVCALPTTSVAGARRRMEEVRTRLHELQPSVEVRVGVAALRRDETLASVVDRAECDLEASPLEDSPAL